MDIYHNLLYFELIGAPIIFITLLFVTAPYGRHAKRGWGLTMNSRIAWILMELPAVLTIGVIYLIHMKDIHPASVIFLILWQFHYCYRTFYFPTQLRDVKKNFPFLLVLFAIFFNVVNGYINGTFLFEIRPAQTFESLLNFHFIFGLTIFIVGFSLHFQSDKIILQLRNNSDQKYSIPSGGLFRYITNPNYFGEFIQWTGWAILTWSLAGLAFALFTLANLLPRAIANHRWYHRTFDNYPSERKIFFPFIY